MKVIEKHSVLFKRANIYYAFAVVFMLFSLSTFAQVSSTVDTTKIKIGEQISYEIQVKADSSAFVVFPEGQTFGLLEMIESFKIDTTTEGDKFKLLKTYKLTQFDSGKYTIPAQKIIINERPFFTDSLRVEVASVQVDTTKQGLYDIKPLIEVDKTSSTKWWYILLALLIIALVAFVLYWFIWRKKPLTEEEEIALLPPYDRAKLALKKLDESQYLIRSEVKEFYSELTLIIRKYLDEKVYDRAMESTTDELIQRLNLLKDANEIPLSSSTIKNLETILKRADLVKFAKSKPDTALAEMDKSTIDKEIDAVKQSLPEPSEEEKLLNQQYKEEQEAKQKRRKIILTVAISAFLLVATIVGFGIKYGFTYVKDTIVGNDNKELLEGEWVSSAYGFPPVYISTPKVLKRTDLPVTDDTKEKAKTTTFTYGSLQDVFSVTVSTVKFNEPSQDPNTQQGQEKTNTIDLALMSELFLKQMEEQGVTDIIVKREQFITPNAAEGLKTYGTCVINVPETDISERANYVLLQFTAENILQQIVITTPQDDTYADDMLERILNSIELKPNEDE
ncbi:MAG: BatD family protein [Winogradskyella sp.]|nr:BatD family protein [Winogradskyella sp.]